MHALPAAAKKMKHWGVAERQRGARPLVAGRPLSIYRFVHLILGEVAMLAASQLAGRPACLPAWLACSLRPRWGAHTNNKKRSHTDFCIPINHFIILSGAATACGSLTPQELPPHAAGAPSLLRLAVFEVLLSSARPLTPAACRI